MRIIKLIGTTILFVFLIGLIAYLNIEKTKELYSWLHFKTTIVNLKSNHKEFLETNKYINSLYIIANKENQQLSVYGKPEHKEKHSFIKSYSFTDFSGKLDPKLKRGDGQIPEGIYKANFLNSRSNYHLSIGLNYPNDFDKEKGLLDNRKDLGDNIFIHGGNATIGCIPIGDDYIEEVFLLVEKVGIENTTFVITPNNLNSFPDVNTLHLNHSDYRRSF